MDTKGYTFLQGLLASIDQFYKSNVDEKDLLLVKSFLFVLRTKGLLNDANTEFPESNVKLLIQNCVEESDCIEIKELYFKYLKTVCDSVRVTYLRQLYNVYHGISDELISNRAKEIFDNEIQNTYKSRKVFDHDNSIQPSELTTLLNSFCDEKSVLSYYNPFAGLASLGLNLPKHIKYLGEEINENTWVLGRLRRLVYNNSENLNYKYTNSFEEWLSSHQTKYDFIGFNPPLNLRLDRNIKEAFRAEYLKIGNANSLIINECFKRLKEDGKMAFVMSSGFLFSSTKSDFYQKKFLIDNGHVEKIISLPEQIFTNTGIAVNIILVSKKQIVDKRVEFIDASNKFQLKNGKNRILDINSITKLISEEASQEKRRVGVNEIAQNNYNLSVNRYVFENLTLSIQENENLVPLGELIRPIQQKLLKPTEEIKVVRIRDLANTALEATKSFNDIESKIPKYKVRLLKDNSLILATLWKSLKPTIYNKIDEDIYYEPGSIFSCSVIQDKVDIDYLVLELQKEYILKQLEQLSVGASIRRISKSDLMQIKVVLPDFKTQEKRKLEFKEAVIRDQQTKFENLKKQLGVDVSDENSFLRHKISGTLRNIRGSYNKLKDIIDNQIYKELPEVYEYKVNPKLNTSLKDYLYRLDRDIKSVHRAVKNVGVELTLHDFKFENLNFIKLVQSYVEEVKNRSNNNFEITINIDEEALKDSKVKEVTFSGDKEILYQVFDNIIENAERHAFSHKKENNRIIVELLYDFEELEVQLDFTNTGKPLPENYSYEAFKRKGSTSGKNAGNGIGGWFMYEVMKLHKGKFGFTDETGPEGGIHEDYATTIELTFPIEIKI